MFKTLANAFKIPELRKKLLYTFFIVVIFRIGSFIPVPFLNPTVLAENVGSMANDGTVFGFLNVISGGAFQYGAIFAMSVTPYINASIIMQLLTVAIPALERIANEGFEGRKKIAQITRYVTVALGLLQGLAFYFYLSHSTGSQSNLPFVKQFDSTAATVFAAAVIVLCFTAGSAIMMWLGEQVNDKGIGNGISILLFSGIVSRAPQTISSLWASFRLGGNNYFTVPLMLIIFLIVIAVIVFFNDAERRIRIQYSKRVVGRKMYGGQSTHMPIKVGMAGVMPIIFASSILMLPSTIIQFFNMSEGWLFRFLNIFRYNSPLYAVLYFLLILGFSYFYIAIQYNPLEIANNLRKNNGAIPGIRPGKPTAEYISKIISKITLIGALYLAVIAILPIIYGSATGLASSSIGGTSVIIVVGVALETVKAIESQMLMRHYKGFLD